MEPPAGVADLGTDVAGVRRAEGLPGMVPAKRVLHRSTETGHMEAVVVLLTLYPVAGEEEEARKHMKTIGLFGGC